MRRTRTHPIAGALVAVAALVTAACTSDEETRSTETSVPTTSETTSTAAVPTTPAPTSPPPTSATTAPPDSSTTAPGTTTTTTTAPPNVPSTPPGSLRPFAELVAVPLLDDATAYSGQALPASLDDVDMPDWLRQMLERDPQLVARIVENGFVVEPGSSRWFHTAYESLAADYGTVFVATDAAYNAWHLAFDKVLRDVEDRRLLPALEQLVSGAVEAARAQAAELRDTALADAAARAAAYYETAALLLGLDVGEVDERAEAAAQLATDAIELTTSPLTGYEPCQAPESFEGCVDYSLFLPRGHYTRSDSLTRYFRVMSLLGQEAFYVDEEESLRLGLLVARVVVADPALERLWRDVYEPSAFLVGVADDFTPLQLATVAAGVAPTWIDDPSAVASDPIVVAIGRALLDGREVAIDPENASVRTMGARFVLDSFVLDQLAWPNVGTEDDRRVFVSPLDLASAWGSPLAQRLQAEAGQTEYAHYETQLAAMRDVIADREVSDWAGTAYDAWLYALEPQFVPRGAAFPEFMRGDAWAAKSLQTAFGSYTELKHDTVLYAKQGTAGEGEGPPPPPYVPHHWVEPDPVAFGRIAAVAALTRDGLSARSMLDDDSRRLLGEVVELTTWLAQVAADELAGVVTSDADNTRIGDIGHGLELLWFESADIEPTGGMLPAADDDAALVADVFRSSFDYLELGVGRVDTIEVIVPDGAGGFQLARGGVYSYYEFWRPSTELRLTDQEWRSLLDAGAQPPRPMWVGAFFSGDGVATEPIVVQDV